MSGSLLSIPLEQLARCFEAVIPATLSTCSRNGVPNMIAVSHVHRIDDRHVAISRQFFRKTNANLRENPRAVVTVTDPPTMNLYRLGVRFDHEETSGTLFDAMAARLEAVASMTGMKGIFRLQAIGVFEVLSVECVPGVIEENGAPDRLAPEAARTPIDSMTQLRTLRRISDCLRSTQDIETLLDSVLANLDEILGFEHSMILLLDESGERLYTVASRGYPESGVGAEVHIGDGIIGTVGRTRRLLRVSSVTRARLYGRAIRSSLEGAPALEVPLPGLPDAESQLAIPLVVQDELLGVLAVESPRELRYDERDEAFLDVVAGHVALGLRNAMRAEEPLDTTAVVPQHAAPPTREPAAPSRVRQFVFYPKDDCVFADGQYLVRNLPGRILWKLLQAYAKEGRAEFSNRELRLDSTLGLPTLRDNLESRLILLRKRLAEKCPDLRIVPSGRGRFRLEVSCGVGLEERA
jgi:hypothetical protein